MQALRITMLLVALAVGYLLFFRSQPQPADLPVAEVDQPAQTVQTEPGVARARTQYKEAMNRAHAAAAAVQAQRKEADAAY